MNEIGCVLSRLVLSFSFSPFFLLSISKYKLHVFMEYPLDVVHCRMTKAI